MKSFTNPKVGASFHKHYKAIVSNQAIPINFSVSFPFSNSLHVISSIGGSGKITMIQELIKEKIKEMMP